MKHFFKQFALSTFVLAIIFTGAVSCSKDSSTAKTYMTNAIITGFDSGTSACSKGIMITFSDTTAPYAASYRNCDTAMSDLGFFITDTFPIKIKLDYSLTSSSACNNYIKILAFEKR